jgi:hypothetical protein
VADHYGAENDTEEQQSQRLKTIKMSQEASEFPRISQEMRKQEIGPPK